MLDANAAKLRESITKLLEQIAKLITPKKQSLVFMINSLDLILNAFIGAKVTDCEDYRALKTVLDTHVTEYIKEELSQYYGKLIEFILVAEGQVSRNSTHMQNQQRIQAGEVENLAREFKENWKAGVEHLSTDVTRSFSNLASGQQILQQIYTQLILYYNRFTQIVRLCWKDPPFKNNLIGPQVILVEIKKYSKDFAN
jgi:hypothetical protein